MTYDKTNTPLIVAVMFVIHAITLVLGKLIFDLGIFSTFLITVNSAGLGFTIYSLKNFDTTTKNLLLIYISMLIGSLNFLVLYLVGMQVISII